MGADSIRILADLGYDPGEIDALLKARVTSTTTNHPQRREGPDPSTGRRASKGTAANNGKAA
jgi:hypothetical protein